ncbi:MAG: hypothetical protein CVU84_15535 [Firmicutes bacterium HGW-Firmicutes-1]|nr:MAG: hypothetical protein CVU84_15535 [Firmicutes bacterium HGW-Firmicutes-1]
MENTYHLDIPMPVLSETELVLRVVKDTTYTGRLEIFNNGEGLFAGIIESVNNIILLKESTIKGNYCIIEYSVNTSCCIIDKEFEDTIIITYNGGEILVPVKIVMVDQKTIALNKKHYPKAIEKQILFELDQKSYHCEDTGILTIINPTNEQLDISLTPLNEYIVFNEKQFKVTNTKTVEMSFKISKLDKILGKVPLKTNPEIELSFKVQMKQGTIISERIMSTYLTELGKLPTKLKITTYKEYKDVVVQIYRQYCDMVLLGNKNKTVDHMLDKLKALINYDKTNIMLRLMYCLLAIECNKKDLAMKEINNIDHYLLYYDKERLDVSDLLMFFLELIKGESVNELLRRWKPMNRDSWLKILLKNKYSNHYTNGYEEFRELYHYGEKNRILFSEVVLLLNSNPLVPYQEDKFYKAVLNWAIAKNAIGMKWLRKIENSPLQLVQHNNINEHIARKLYLKDENKNMLILLCAFYIKTNRIDEEAFIIYKKSLAERCRIVGLEEKYIQASYHNNELLNIEYLKMTFDVQMLDEKYKQFFYLNLFIQKERYKSLYFYHSKDIEQITKAFLKDNVVPDDPYEKVIYLRYLVENKLMDCIISLFEARKLLDIPEELMEELIRNVEEVHPIYAIQMAREAYKNHNDQPIILEVLAKGLKGTISDLLDFYKVSTSNGFFPKIVVEEILFKGILTRKYSDEVMDVYYSYALKEDNNVIHQWMKHYITAQILIEDTKVSPNLITLLEDIAEKESDFGVYLALLKTYTKVSRKNEALIIRLIKELIDAGIFFSWYMQLVPENYLGERHRVQQYFEYNSNSLKKIIFNYRLDDDKQFRSVEMKHVALGLYVVNVIMFYNEGIQYYIEEIDSEGNRDIKSSDLFMKKDMIEQQESESLFDLINTIEMSKEMKDIASLQTTVEHYINISSKEIKKIYIL